MNIPKAIGVIALVLVAMLAMRSCMQPGERSQTAPPPTIPPEIVSASTSPTPPPKPEVAREQFRNRYERFLSGVFPALNGITARVEKTGKGFALMGRHSYFTRSTFDIGPGGPAVSEWIGINSKDLTDCGIVRVGVSSTEGLGYQWYDVK